MVEQYIFISRPEGKPIVCEMLYWSSYVETLAGLDDYSDKDDTEPMWKAIPPPRIMDWEEKKSKKKDEKPDPFEWNTDDVCKWAEQYGFSQYTSAFKEHEVDGRVLLQLLEKDAIALGITKIGPRRKFLSRIRSLNKIHHKMKWKKEEEEKRTQFSTDPISITIWSDTNMFVGFLVPWLKEQTLTQVAMVHYTGLDRTRTTLYGSSHKDNVIEYPPAVPYWLTKFKNCRIQKCRKGGSGGESRFTANITFKFESVRHQLLDIHARNEGMITVMDFLNLERGEEREQFERAWEAKDLLFTSPGITISRDILSGATKAATWAPSMRDCWSPETHSAYNKEVCHFQSFAALPFLTMERMGQFKQAVFATMMCHRRGTNKYLSLLTDHLLYRIFGILSLNYHLDPFAGYTFPHTEKLRKAIKAREETDDTAS